MATLLTRRARSSDTPEILRAIADADCNLAIWERAGFADFGPLVAGDPEDIRFETALADLPALLLAALTESGFAAPHLHATLVNDAALLARHFCDALELVRIELRLEVVRTDACRKFHADYVRARLITTYHGEGTDWLDDADAARVAAGAEPLRINRMRAFDVGLFKGKLGTDHPTIHRSPPIAESGGARLLMVLNPASRAFVDAPHSPLS
jgi:hypothetical protein